MINIAVFISGRGSNFKAINESIKNNYINNGKIVLLISNNEKALGLKYAYENKIQTKILSKHLAKDQRDNEILHTLKEHNIHLVCLAGYMSIIGKSIVNTYHNRIMNIHPSLLPSFPGLNAQKQALDYGVKITGCTLHFVDHLVDHGPIILQHAVHVEDSDDVTSLSDRILKYEHIIYPKGIKLFTENKLIVKGRKVYIKQ
ncbi:MAG: phosphoribosylglycinamide formyltransferase [Deferribacterota bacterium]|nr:phosphoribosylglycinamide formyltransferase [Deferribacterota bacterium]